MKTLVFSETEIGRIGLASQLLSDGELVAIPTETVYGLAADATNRSAAIERCNLLTGRDREVIYE
jgi:L-threonylcarbamoyladenylate synthase